MKKVSIKRSLVLMAVTGSSLLGAASVSYGFVSNNAPGSGGGDEIVQAIQQLGNTLTALATSGANTLSDAVYQVDQYLPSTVQANTASADLQSEVVAATTTQTLAGIKSSLQIYPQQVIPPLKTSANAMTPLQNLTSQVTASDTLSSPKNQQSRVFNANPAKAPDNDNYFAMDSLIGPEAYTPDQLKASQYYIQYLTQAYLPLSNTINFKPLAGLDYDSFANFVSSNSVYQTYQASVRSYIALTSVALSTFNRLQAERTVQEGLGTSVGLMEPSSDGTLEAVADASPLQVQDYMANRRVNNVQWYVDMAANSPATVQRESLFVLAEIEMQLQQLHTDNERLIATLAALELATAQGQKPALAVQESNVNAAIGVITGNSAAAQASQTIPQIPQSSQTGQLPAMSGTGQTGQIPTMPGTNQSGQIPTQ